MRRIVAALVISLSALPRLAAGQSIAPGSRVRVTQLAEGTRAGTVVALTTDTLEVRMAGSAATSRLALDQVTRLEVSRGSQRHPAYAGVGAIIGLTVGTVGGYASGDDDCSRELICISKPAGALIGGAVLGAAGAVLGLIAGAIPSESWERVQLEGHRVSLVTPHGRSVGLSVAF